MEETTNDIAVTEAPAEKLATAEQETAAEFSSLDYLKEIYLNTQEQVKLDKKKVRMMRFCAVCMLLVVVLFAATIFLAGPYVKAIVNDINDITNKILAIDINSITGQLGTLMENANKAVVNADAALQSVSGAADNIAQIDMKSLNGAITELTKTVENFSKMDIGKLNDAITELDAAAKALGSIKIPKILGGAG